MGFRVVNSSSFTFETDLPPSSRHIHPSGALHAFRTTPNSSGLPGREEHTFAWITNSIHVENAVSHLEKFGFNRNHGISFIPYSTKTNWLNRYPHAAPAIECADNGKVMVYLNWRPYPNGLSSLGQDMGIDAAAVAAVAAAARGTEDDSNSVVDGGDEDDIISRSGVANSKKRKNKSRAMNMIQDNSYMPDAERDELHVEIYHYLSWLHAKLAELENKASAAAALASVAGMKGDEIEPNVVDEKRSVLQKELKDKKGVDVTGLKEVLENLESTFVIIPNVKLEIAAAAEAEKAMADEAKAAAAAEEESEGEGEEALNNEDKPASAAATSTQKGGGTPPFLEEALWPALKDLVLGREVAGKPRRRSRKRARKRVNNPNRMHDKTPKDWDTLFQRLVEYREKHGNCMVSKNFTEDAELANWVRGVRERKGRLLKKGINVDETPETVPPGELLRAKTLTVTRLEQLDAIGFVWQSQGPKTAWEVRFRDCMEYYTANNGKWPSQSMGSLGEWVHKQRGCYARRDVNYMKYKAPKLDEVGFEWTPRGYTRMTWDEGFEMLMEYRRINGHYNVPIPNYESGNDGQPVDKKSDTHRFYKWVESLHAMYRSYKLGRQSGSLTDERVVLLIKHGFLFRNI